MSLNKIVQPKLGEELDIIVNSILTKGDLTTTCGDNQLLNYTPLLIGSIGQVLTRVGTNSVEFKTIPSGPSGNVQNPLQSDLDIGSFDIP